MKTGKKKKQKTPQHLKTKVMASGPIASWQIDGETMEMLPFCSPQGHKESDVTE